MSNTLRHSQHHHARSTTAAHTSATSAPRSSATSAPRPKATRATSATSTLDLTQVAALVTQAQAGSQDAFTELYHLYYNRIYAVVRKYLGTETTPEAQDVTQETFVSAFDSLRNLRDPQAFHKWLYRIALRRSMEALADRIHESNHIDATDLSDLTEDQLREELNTEFLPHAALLSKEQRAHVLQLIDQLPPTQRSALIMRYFEDFTIPEIAEISDVPQNAVYQRLYRGRAHLRSLYTQSLDTPNPNPSTIPAPAPHPLTSTVPVLALILTQEMPTLATSATPTPAACAHTIPFWASASTTATGTAAATVTATAAPAASLGAKLAIAAAATALVAGTAAGFSTLKNVRGGGHSQNNLAAERVPTSKTPAAATATITESLPTSETSEPAVGAVSSPPAKPAASSSKTGAEDSAPTTKPKAKPKPKPAPKPAQPQPKPQIQLAHATLSLAAGTTLSQAQLLQHAGAFAFDSTGNRLDIAVQGYDALDFMTPGSYTLILSAKKATPTKLLIKIE